MNNKRYEKALYLYNNGRIEKAIDICEKEISRDLSNSKVLNLKGLLLYLKGNLEEAVALWKINKDYNNDDIASSYLKDVQSDLDKMELYREAVELIENLAIGEAIDILESCMKSDFNSINVNNALAVCYFRKGDNDKVKEHLEKVFRLDRNNEKAKRVNKKLDSLYKYKNRKETLLKITLTTFVIAIITGAILLKREDKINLNLEPEGTQSNSNYIEENEENLNNQNNKVIDENQNTENVEIKVLSNEEIRGIYISATEYYEERRYEEAIDLLEETINKSSNNHLDDDILFLLAASYESYGNISKAIEKFDKYILNYGEGSYIQESYYRAALLYKDLDIIKSKEYANKILINYPNSIYNNSYVQEIINL
ncbi:tetratricopeptide repeat protein [Clostridium sp. AL.422]|uniref:tetratricopeptide repeat protein n=1 Tax=Clostridium TaxID=1485 RepID=UPI00293DBA89|nr:MULTISPECIES: tetratricopeptide repeat protein [unclassified Clostridium]MDV4149225.1 tetratricopeptide repeat protein [Clostridium sp. AL.422]